MVKRLSRTTQYNCGCTNKRACSDFINRTKQIARARYFTERHNGSSIRDSINTVISATSNYGESVGYRCRPTTPITPGTLRPGGYFEASHLTP